MFRCAAHASLQSASAAPPGIVPAVPEALCYHTVVPTNPSGVSIRQYTATLNATFASSGANGAYPGGVQSSVASLISYFSGANDDQRKQEDDGKWQVGQNHDGLRRAR